MNIRQNCTKMLDLCSSTIKSDGKQKENSVIKPPLLNSTVTIVTFHYAWYYNKRQGKTTYLNKKEKINTSLTHSHWPIKGKATWKKTDLGCIFSSLNTSDKSIITTLSYGTNVWFCLQIGVTKPKWGDNYSNNECSRPNQTYGNQETQLSISTNIEKAKVNSKNNHKLATKTASIDHLHIQCDGYIC